MGITGRRVLVALTASALALGLTACGTTLTRESFSDGSPVPEPVGKVRFDVNSGAVAIRVEPGAPVSLRRTITHEGARPGRTHRVEGDTLVLDKCGEDCSVDYDLVIPAGLPIGGHITSGDVTVEGGGLVRVRGTSGTVVLRHVAGADVETTSGAVEVGLAGPGSVRVKVTSGDITVAALSGSYQVRADTSSGKTELGVPNTTGAPNLLDLVSTSGDVTVRSA